MQANRAKKLSCIKQFFSETPLWCPNGLMTPVWELLIEGDMIAYPKCCNISSKDVGFFKNWGAHAVIGHLHMKKRLCALKGGILYTNLYSSGGCVPPVPTYIILKMTKWNLSEVKYHSENGLKCL